ncbi:MAG: hypothetical protein AAB289_10220, partial [Chloroflexota bacterium]
MKISLEATLVPLSVWANTRKKYLPSGTFVAVTVGAADSVLALTRSANPLAEPACTRYDVGVPPRLGGVQFKKTVRPLT